MTNTVTHSSTESVRDQLRDAVGRARNTIRSGAVPNDKARTKTIILRKEQTGVLSDAVDYIESLVENESTRPEP